MDEGLIGSKEAVPSGQQIPLQPALQGVLGEHLHDPALAGQVRAVRVLRQDFRHPDLLARVIDVVQAVGGGLIGAEKAEVRGIGLDHVAQETPEHARVLHL